MAYGTCQSAIKNMRLEDQSEFRVMNAVWGSGHSDDG